MSELERKVRELADECASSSCIHLNEMYGKLRALLAPVAGDSGEVAPTRHPLLDHEPVAGASKMGGVLRGSIVGCSCLSARDYRAAGFSGGAKGYLQHLLDLGFDEITTNTPDSGEVAGLLRCRTCDDGTDHYDHALRDAVAASIVRFPNVGAKWWVGPESVLSAVEAHLAAAPPTEPAAPEAETAATKWCGECGYMPKGCRHRATPPEAPAVEAATAVPDYGVVSVAWCPEHGLHGQRTDCHTCGGPVTQVPMQQVAATRTWPCDFPTAHPPHEAKASDDMGRLIGYTEHCHGGTE